MSQATLSETIFAAPTVTSRVSTVARLLLTLLAFIAYAAAVLSLHQDRTLAFVNEEVGPIPAALSHRLYGAPLGSIDTAFFKYFMKSQLAGEPAKQAVDQIRRGEVTPSGQLMTSVDGIGIGGMVAAELAFAVFGPHARSLPLFYLLLIGIATALFAARYRDERMSAAPILLTAMTLLILTPLSDHPAVTEAPLGGIRSYALVVILPALHWVFELAEGPGGASVGWRRRWGLLVAQLPILALGTLVRGSPLYLALPLLASALYALWRHGKAGRRTTAAVLAAPLAILLIGVEATAQFGFPDYVANGRAFVTIWHRALLGIGVHPDFPFPGMREAFPCPEIAQGFVGVSDHNGHCVWWAYAHKHNLSPQQVMSGLYGGEYEDAMREAYFYVLRTYPRQVLESYFYYKPLNTLGTVRAELSNLSPTAAPVMMPLAIAQIVLLVAFIAARPPPAPLRDLAWRVAVLLPFLVAVIPPLLIAWPAPHTVMDLIAYLLCGLIIVFWFVVSGFFYFVIRGTRSLLAPAGS